VLRFDATYGQNRDRTCPGDGSESLESEADFARLAAGFQQVAEDCVVGARIFCQTMNRSTYQCTVRKSNVFADRSVRFRQVHVRSELCSDPGEPVDRDLQRVPDGQYDSPHDLRNLSDVRLFLADLHDVGAALDCRRRDFSDIAPCSGAIEDHDESRGLQGGH
jgi:hypothetical protein